MNEESSIFFDTQDVEYLFDVCEEARSILSSHPLLEDSREDIASAVDQALELLRAEVPSNYQDIAVLCSLISQSLIKVYKNGSTFEKNVTEYKSHKSLFVRVSRLREKARRAITKQAKTLGKWNDEISIDTDFNYAREVRTVLLKYFGVTESCLVEGDTNYEKIELFFKVTLANDYREILSFTRFYGQIDSEYETLWDLLAEAFPEFKELLLSKENVSWKIDTVEQRKCLRERCLKQMYQDFGISIKRSPDKATREIDIERILSLKPSDLERSNFSLDSAYGQNRPFSTFADFMYFLYGRLYRIKKSEFNSEKISLRDDAVLREAEFKRRLLEGLSLDESDIPERGTKEWWEFIKDVIDVSQIEMKTSAFGMSHIMSSEDNLTVKELTYKVLKQYGVEQWMFEHYARKFINDRVEFGLTVAPSVSDRILIEAILKGDNDCCDSMFTRFQECPKGLNKDTFKVEVKRVFLERVRKMGLRSPVNLIRVFESSYSSVRVRMQRTVKASQAPGLEEAQ